MRDRHHPRRTIHVGAEPVPVALGGLTRVQRPSGPAARRSRATSPRTARACAATAAPTPSWAVRNVGQHAVAGALHHLPAVTLDRVAHQLVVMGQRVAHRVGMLLPQARRTLQIGEQEGHRLRRHSATPKSRAAGA